MKSAYIDAPLETVSLENKLPEDNTKNMLGDWGSYMLRIPMFLVPIYGHRKFTEWKAKGHRNPAKSTYIVSKYIIWAACAYDTLHYSGVI